jgi:ATP-binding cassette, subfamily B, bacterial
MIRLSSSIPGRQRWEVPALRDRPKAAAAVERLLRGEAGLISAEANPLTGRVLLRHGTGLDNRQVREFLQAALDAVGLRETRARAPGGSRLSLAPPLVALGAGAFALKWLGPLAPPVLLATGVIAVSVVVITRGVSKREPGAGEKTSTLLRLYRYTRAHHPRLYLAVTCSVISKVLHFAPPLLIGQAVDLLISGVNPTLVGLGITTVMGQLMVLGGSVVVLWGAASALEYAYRYLWRNLSQEVQHELQLDAYAHVQRASMGFLENRSTGALATILNEDANQLEVFFNDAANDALQLATNVVAVGIAYLVLAPQVAWIALAPMPLVAWTSLRFRERVGPLYARARELAGVSDGHLVNNLSGITTIRSFTTEDYESRRVQQLSETYLAVNKEATRLNAAFTPTIRMIVITGFAATMIRAGMLVTLGVLSPGSYAFLIFLTQRFLWPMTILGQTIDLNQRAMASASRVLDLLDAPPATPGGGRSLPIEKVRGEITFNRVDFAYQGGARILDDFSLDIPAGKTVAFVGPTGAGKTTLIKLLLRFYELTSGRILLDGHDIRDLDTRALRRAVGLVSQDVFLFDGTIRDNIRYGSFNASDEAVRSAARMAEAEEFILRLPRGYDTVVGERGMKLSGGQRQRLCIARAILKDPPILVLDEATSSVDNETEAAIQRAIERMSKGRTVIMIAHRLSTVRNVDCIYVIDKQGRIIQRGRHDELVKKDGFYASLWRVQTGTATRGSTPPLKD